MSKHHLALIRPKKLSLYMYRACILSNLPMVGLTILPKDFVIGLLKAEIDKWGINHTSVEP